MTPTVEPAGVSEKRLRAMSRDARSELHFHEKDVAMGVSARELGLLCNELLAARQQLAELQKQNSEYAGFMERDGKMLIAMEQQLASAKALHDGAFRLYKRTVEELIATQKQLAEMRGGNSTVIRKEVLRCLLEHAINGRALTICEPENTYIREAYAALAPACPTCGGTRINPRWDGMHFSTYDCPDCAQPERQGEKEFSESLFPELREDGSVP